MTGNQGSVSRLSTSDLASQQRCGRMLNRRTGRSIGLQPVRDGSGPGALTDEVLHGGASTIDLLSGLIRFRRDGGEGKSPSSQTFHECDNVLTALVASNETTLCFGNLCLAGNVCRPLSPLTTLPVHPADAALVPGYDRPVCASYRTTTTAPDSARASSLYSSPSGCSKASSTTAVLNAIESRSELAGVAWSYGAK